MINDGDRSNYNRLKTDIPAVTISGCCTTRRAGLTDEEREFVHSGWLQADFDLKDNLLLEDPDAAKDIRANLLADKYVGGVFVGPSGEGIKAVVRIYPSRHKESWYAAEKYFRDTYGLTLDKMTKDPLRLCFASYDPQADVSAYFTELPIPNKVEADATARLDATRDEPLNVGYSHNDAGRAERYVDRFIDDVRYVPDRDLWFTWCDDRWQIDRDGAIVRLALLMSREMLAEIDDMLAEAYKRRASEDEIREIGGLKKEPWNCGNRRSIQNYLELAKVDTRIHLDSSCLDKDPWVAAAPNGIINLKTGEWREYSREDFNTRALGYEIDPNARCPRWEKFMEEVLPDPEVRRFMQKAAGYSLTGDTREQAFFFLFGNGKNGKSVFTKTLSRAFGSYAQTIGKGITTSNARGDYPEKEIAALVGLRFGCSSETAQGDRMNEGVIKDLTGEDSMTGRKLYKEEFSFYPILKLWIFGNHKPSIKGNDFGIWRRVRLIAFEENFEGRADENLTEKLKAEASGILNWIIQGCLLWQIEGLKPPSNVVQAVQDYQAEEDTLADFLEEAVEESTSGGGIPHQNLYKKYLIFCESNGIRFKVTSKKLAKTLKERGWRSGKKSYSKCVWQGVSLLGDAQ
jgi:putative DNA primase/helicase